MVKAKKAVIPQVVIEVVKALNPRDADTKYMGLEPGYEVQPTDNRLSVLAMSFAWYVRFYGRKDAISLLKGYLDLKDRKADAKLLSKVDDQEFNMTLCWVARMSLRGLILTKDESTRLEADLTRLLDLAKANKTSDTVVEVKEKNGPNVQEIMRERTLEAGGELEGMLDDFMLAGSPTNHSFKPIDELSKRNIMVQHVPMLTDAWKRKQAEFEEVVKGKDEQLVEAYSRLSKKQVKNTLKFIDHVLSDLNSYISVKKANKAPRKRKAVPVEKIVARLKHTKSFTDASLKLDLVGLSPIKLHGAGEAWIYDTGRRKLHHYVADDYTKSFVVKGNTLLGFDTKTSEIKTLRKPAEQIKEIMSSRPAARKYFKEIRAVSVVPKGRFNAGMIILKAY